MLCHQMFMAKYSLDSAGQVLLQVEIPIDGLDREFPSNKGSFFKHV